MRFAVRSEHLDTARSSAIDAISPTRRLLPIPAGPTSPTMRPCPSSTGRASLRWCSISHSRPTSVDTRRPPASALGGHCQQAAGDHRRSRALNAYFFGFAQVGRVLDQPCRGLTEHHPAGRRDRFHPLRQSDLFTDRGVIQTARTDLTGDHRAGIQPDAQMQGETVALFHLGASAAPPAGCPAPPGTRVMRDPPTQPARRTPP